MHPISAPVTPRTVPLHAMTARLFTATCLLATLWASDAVAAVCSDTDDVHQLTVGQTKDAGDVKVCNSFDSGEAVLRIEYDATYPFCLLETNTDVATSVSDIPQNGNGSPRPSQFEYSSVYNECLGTATIIIPLATIGDGVGPTDNVFVAAHAIVKDEDGYSEVAWGGLYGDGSDGTRFVERGNWATYFTHEVGPLCGGGESKCVFVTGYEYTSDLGGLSGADTICQDLANGSEKVDPGTYRAWLSTDSIYPADGTRFTQASVPYRRVDGWKIADDWSDLTDGMLDAPIDLAEDGTTPTYNQYTGLTVWTNTTAFGTSTGPRDCTDWTYSGLSATGAWGTADQSDSQWTDYNYGACIGDRRLYCFEQ